MINLLQSEIATILTNGMPDYDVFKLPPEDNIYNSEGWQGRGINKGLHVYDRIVKPIKSYTRNNREVTVAPDRRIISIQENVEIVVKADGNGLPKEWDNINDIYSDDLFNVLSLLDRIKLSTPFIDYLYWIETLPVVYRQRYLRVPLVFEAIMNLKYER